MLAVKGTNTVDLRAYWLYDTLGRVTQEEYPNTWLGQYQEPYHGEFRFGRGYDSAGRLEKISSWGRMHTQFYPNSTAFIAENGNYDAEDRLTSLTFAGQTESRTYNNLGQLTGISGGLGGASVNLTYGYEASTNDGLLAWMTDAVAGETVRYQYDTLKRLSKAETDGPQWGQMYGFDGFGNLTSQSVTKGTAPTMSLTIDGSTNRIANYAYDANGNVVNDLTHSYTWDANNRLATVDGAATGNAYDPENRRVFDGTYYYFWSPDGRRLGKYSINPNDGKEKTEEVYVYFGGRMIATGVESTTTLSGVIYSPVLTDRVGSVRVQGTQSMNYFPYGQERPATGNGKDKFGTYWRDSNSGLDYAQQRYYGSAVGRFMSADPSGANWNPADPHSWNDYSYVQGDPVNWTDPDGLVRCGDLPVPGMGTLKNAMLSNTDLGLMARVVYSEAPAIQPQYFAAFGSSAAKEATAVNAYEQFVVATALMNRYRISIGAITVKDPNGKTLNRSSLGFYSSGHAITLRHIILKASGAYGSGWGTTSGGDKGDLKPGFMSILRSALDAPATAGGGTVSYTGDNDDTYTLGLDCARLVFAWNGSVWAYFNFFPGEVGLVTDWNKAGPSADPVTRGTVNFGRIYAGGNTYYGFLSR